MKGNQIFILGSVILLIASGYLYHNTTVIINGIEKYHSFLMQNNLMLDDTDNENYTELKDDYKMLYDKDLRNEVLAEMEYQTMGIKDYFSNAKLLHFGSIHRNNPRESHDFEILIDSIVCPNNNRLDLYLRPIDDALSNYEIDVEAKTNNSTLSRNEIRAYKGEIDDLTILLKNPNTGETVKLQGDD